MPSSQLGFGRTVGIVDAYDDPNAESDLATYRAYYGLPACTTANGCFRKVAQNGSTTYPAPAPATKNWAAEIALDLEMVSATCPNCHIVLVETNSDANSDLLAGVDEAVNLGVNAVNMSWGAAEYSTETSDDSHFNHPGIAFVASSGDYGYGTTIWPAASPNVFAVGATDLQADAYGNWSETAWAGTTSGCSLYEPKPSYQKDTGCANRTIADVSAVGGTALSMYLTYPVNGWSSGWQGAGGTSASAPIVAGMLVLAPQDQTATTGPGSWYSSAYTPGAFSVNDITSGSTGSCGSYLCNAGPGYDGPTGLGSPDGLPPAANSRAPSELWGAANQGEAGPPACKSGDPVVCATGDLTESATDLAVPGRGRSLAFTRTYNALDAASASAPDALGWGWTDSYAMSLTTNATTGAVTVHQGDGATVTFSSQGGGYTAPGWVTASLIKNGDGTFTYTLADQTSDTFSASGKLISESDRNGYQTTLAYNGAGQLSTVTDPAGRSLTFSYNGSGQLTSVTDPSGRSVTYGYDANGNLTAITDATGNSMSYGYDSTHRLTTMTDARGGATTNSYDASNRVITQTDPMGRVTTFAYGSNTTTITDPKGNVTVETYNPYLQLIKVVRGQGSPQAATWSFTYNAYTGEQTSTTDPDGHTTYATWDAQGNETSVTDPLQRYTSATYDAANDRTGATDAAGVTTTFSYDAHHNLVSTSTPVSGTSRTATTVYGYDPNHPGDLTSVTNPNGNSTHFAYNADGDLASVTDPDGNLTTATYNGIGWRTSIVSPNGNVPGAKPAAFTTTFGYDSAGRPTTVADPLARTTTTSYDANGNKLTVTDANGRTTSYAYDADNELTKVSHPDGSSSASGFDKDGNLISQTDGNGHTTSYGYDALNRLTSTIDPLQRTTSFSYDPSGNRVSLNGPTGGTTTYAYDAANELTRTAYSDGKTPTVTYGYDADGRRVQMSDGTGTSSYSYDSLGRRTGQTDGAGNQVGYGYDLASRLTSLTYPGGQTVTRGYDPAGNLTSVTDWLGNKTSYSYDADRNHTAQTRPNSTSAALTYDAGDQLIQIKDTGPAGTILNLPYTYDPVGNLTSANATATAQPVTQTYGYDRLNRLTGATVPAGNSGGAQSNGYAYDAANNLTQITTGSLTTTLTHDAANQLTATTNASGTTNYSNDPNGNRTGIVDAVGNTTRYGYDQANRLTSFSGPPLSAADSTGALTESATYTYNGDGLRVAKQVTVSGVGVNYPFTWDLGAAFPLALTDGTNSYIYGAGDQPIEQINSATGAVSWLLTDRQGSVRALTNAAGAVTATINYSPYGQTLSTTGTVNTPLGYDGQYTDPESGLIYLRARYYDPTTGQFLTRDPLNSLTQQAYSYGNDSPLNFTDPSGEIDLNPCDWSIVGDVCNFIGGIPAFVWNHAGDIGIGAGVLALAASTGGLGTLAVALGAVSVASGAVATTKDVAQGKYLSAAIDALGTALGGASAADHLLAAIDEWASAFAGESAGALFNDAKALRALADRLDKLGYGSLAYSIYARIQELCLMP